MLRWWILTLLSCVLLWSAAGDHGKLQEASQKASSQSKTKVFDAYNDYKSLYLKALVEKDAGLRYKALQGIVKTGEILSIDISKYQGELSHLKAPTITPKKNPSKKTTNSTYHRLKHAAWEKGRLALQFSGTLRSHEVNYFKIFDKASKRYRYIFDIHAVLGKTTQNLKHSKLQGVRLAQRNANTLRLVIENDKALKLSFKRDGNRLVVNPSVGVNRAKKVPKVALSDGYHLKKVHWRDGKLVLQFDAALVPSQVTFSKLADGKRYRYWFDFKGGMLDQRHDLRHQKVKRIRLAQFDTKRMRLVVENHMPLEVSHQVDGREVIVNFGLSPKHAPKPITQKKTVRKVIVIDPGHGGKDAGAVGHKKYREKAVVMQISRELTKILKAQGYTVHLTRSGDKFIKLQKRTQFANRKNADLFISIHANAVPKRNVKKAYGIETYFLSNDHKAGSERAKRVAAMENSKDLRDVNFYGQQNFINILNREKIKMSERLAHDLQGNILAELRKKYSKIKDGGVREGPFWILVGAQMPAVLVEVGFITHPMEGERLATRSYQKRFAKGLANGINQYFYYNP